MLIFVVGALVGAFVGVVTVSLFAVSAYEHGFEDARALMPAGYSPALSE